MKLHRLKLPQGFRSLEPGFEIHFLREMEMDRLWEFSPYVLVGRNGSGKSNLLEALAHIFYHLECMTLRNLPDTFLHDEENNPEGWRSDKALIDEYELEYFIAPEKDYVQVVAKDHARISIIKKAGQSPMVKLDGDVTLTSQRFRDFLPEYVLGYSSGENEILSLPFIKMCFANYDEYEQMLYEKLPYSEPEGRLVFLDPSHSQAMLLANYLVGQSEDYTMINHSLGIESIVQFRIVLRKVELLFDYPRLGDEVEQRKAIAKEDKLKLLSGLQQQIENFKNCATAWTESEKLITLDYYVDNACKEAFSFYFRNDALRLFETFTTMMTLSHHHKSVEMKKELYQSNSLYVNELFGSLSRDHRVLRFENLIIKKQGVGEVMLKSLSDGEHQLLHSLNLFLLFRNKRALFLFDEPETHFNPDWRAEFITTLKNCLPPNSKGPISRELLITSHSPFIVSDSPRENVLIFKKDHQGQVSCARPHFRTFGASVNLINIRIFDKQDTIGQVAKKALDSLYQRLEDGEDADKLIEEANALLGDSVEKTLFINHAKGNRLV